MTKRRKHEKEDWISIFDHIVNVKRMRQLLELSKNVNRGSYSYFYKYDKFGKIQRFDDDFNTIYYYDEYGNDNL